MFCVDGTVHVRFATCLLLGISCVLAIPAFARASEPSSRLVRLQATLRARSPARTRRRASLIGRVRPARPANVGRYLSFDWDDTIRFMPTAGYMVRRGAETNAELRAAAAHAIETGDVAGIQDAIARGDLKGPVTTARFAEIRTQLGVSGEWADYSAHPDFASPRFRDSEARNFFVEDLERALLDPRTAAPGWTHFVQALSQRESAQRLSIITSRFQSPRTILAGLRRLKARGLIRFLPRQANIFPVNHPSLQARIGASLEKPSLAKVEIAKAILDRAQQDPAPEGAVWEFREDDPGTSTLMAESLAAAVREAPQRWNRVRIHLVHVGPAIPGRLADTLTISASGDLLADTQTSTR